MEEVFDLDFTVNTVEPIVDIDALEVFVVETRQGEIESAVALVNGKSSSSIMSQWTSTY